MNTKLQFYIYIVYNIFKVVGLLIFWVYYSANFLVRCK